MDRFLTQCPQCATLFKVSANQLQLGQGQVRCGSCMHVFNGEEAIIQSNTDTQSESAEQEPTPQKHDSSGQNMQGSETELSQETQDSNQSPNNDKNDELAALDKELDSYLDDFGLDDADLDSDVLLESQLSEAEAQLLNTPLDQLNDFAADASEILDMEDFDDFDLDDDLDDFDLDASLDIDNLLSDLQSDRDHPELGLTDKNKIVPEHDNANQVAEKESNPDQTYQTATIDNVLNFDALKQKRIAEKEQADTISEKESVAPKAASPKDVTQTNKDTDLSQHKSSFSIDQFMISDTQNAVTSLEGGKSEQSDSILEREPANQDALTLESNDLFDVDRSEQDSKEFNIDDPDLDDSDLDDPDLEDINFDDADIEGIDFEDIDLAKTEDDDTLIQELMIDELLLEESKIEDDALLESLLDDESPEDQLELETLDLDFESSDALEDLGGLDEIELDAALNENIAAIESEQPILEDPKTDILDVEQKNKQTTSNFESDLIDFNIDSELDIDSELEGSFAHQLDLSHKDNQEANIQKTDIQELHQQEEHDQELDDREVVEQEAEIIADFIAAQSELDLEQNVVDALEDSKDIDELSRADSEADLLGSDLLESDLLVDDSEVETQTLFDQYNDEIESISITSEERILADLNPQQIEESLDENVLDNVNELSDVEEGKLPWQQQSHKDDATLEAVLKKNDLNYDALAIADIQINLDQADEEDDEADILEKRLEPSFESTFDINEQLIEVEDYSNLKRFLWFMGCIILVFTLLLQYIWFYRAELQYDPFWQPVVEEICQSLPCQLAPKRDISKIKISHRLVKPIGDNKKLMSVDLMLVNNATFEQPYPTILVDFSDHNGAVLSQEKVLPAQYLSAKRQLSLMPKAVDIHVHFEINKPANQATGYTFKFE
jgi:predicted Zn finger-like uncharacterized protein